MPESLARGPLHSEDEAWTLLASILAGERPAGADLTPTGLLADEWAHLLMTLEGPQFHGTITPPVMETLLTLQAAINRSLALAAHGIENARLLTDLEKSKVEIQVKVTEGTTTIDVDGTKIINHIADVVGSHMTGEQLMIVAIAIAVLFFGTSAYRTYLSKRAETRGRELESTDRAALVGQIGGLSEQETERARILAAAIAREPKVVVIKGEAERFYDSVLKSAADAGNALS